MRAMTSAAFATVIAGFLDAVGFTYLAGLYISFMSGNSTGLGIALAQGRYEFCVATTAVIAGFVVGAFAGTALHMSGSVGAIGVACLQLSMLLTSICVVDRVVPYVSLLPVCLAMGMQNAVPRSVAGIDVGRSFVTGALFGVGHTLALALREPGYLRQAVVHGATWVALVGGAFSGGLALVRFGLMGSLGICAVAIFMFILFDLYCRLFAPALNTPG